MQLSSQLPSPTPPPSWPVLHHHFFMDSFGVFHIVRHSLHPHTHWYPYWPPKGSLPKHLLYLFASFSSSLSPTSKLLCDFSQRREGEIYWFTFKACPECFLGLSLLLLQQHHLLITGSSLSPLLWCCEREFNFPPHNFLLSLSYLLFEVASFGWFFFLYPNTLFKWDD